MGNKSSNSSLRNAIIYLNISADSIKVNDDKFWSQIWSEDATTAVEIIKGIRTQEIRMLRDGSPRNFAALTYKMIQLLCFATGTLCNTQSQQTAVLNASRILTRLIPCIFEDDLWRSFFEQNYLLESSGEERHEPELVYPKKSEDQRDYMSYLPVNVKTSNTVDSGNGAPNSQAGTAEIIEDLLLENQANLKKSDTEQSSKELLDDLSSTKSPLFRSLILSICDLLFCPEFTVSSRAEGYLLNKVDTPPEDLRSLPTCNYVWEPGVGFDSSANSTTYYDKSRSELLRLLLVCLSSTLYETPTKSVGTRNRWLEVFVSNENRHALPLFTSFLNTVFIYNPSKLMPFHSLIFDDCRKELVELTIQVLIVTLDYHSDTFYAQGDKTKKNLFIEYLSRIHRDEDNIFLIKGFTKLLNNCLEQGYLLNPGRQVDFNQELLILFWKICNLNKRFLSYILKTTDVLDIVVPILYHLNENFQDTTKTAIIHLGVFNLLILSGERNFGVRLNKPYCNGVLTNLPSFSGSYADLTIIVFHKLILYGQNLNQLYDFLLTILVNISPYLKALTMLASKCLIQLFEIFSSPYIILTEPNYHQLILFLLEIFNNIIQYQFGGNTNLVYIIIKKKDAFIKLSNLPTTQQGIDKILGKLLKKKQHHMLIAKMLAESNTDQVNDNNESQGQLVHNSEGYVRPIATITSDGHSLQQMSTSCLKQEVSLVATPDICLVTQSIFPFDAENPSSEAFLTSPQATSTPTAAMSFDDILNQTSATVDTGAGASTPETEGTRTICSSSSLEDVDTDESRSEEKAAVNQSNIDRQPVRWRATPDKMRQWKQSLPLHTTLRMIEVLNPQLDHIKNKSSSHQEETEMIKFLQNGTLVGLLPVPHPISIRKYRTNNETTLWFRACTWGIIYVRNTFWIDTNVRLIKII